MSNLFERSALAKIIDSEYPTEIKVEEIINLYKQSRVQLLNEVSNQIGHVIDLNKHEQEQD